jgi:DNA repair protein RecO (recombination protein O)
MLVRVEGIVIRALDYGEGDKILSVFTRQAGKLSVMARGAKKIKSRYTAAAQLFTYGEYTFFRTHSMGTLRNAEIQHSYHKLREQLHTAAYAAYLAELTERLTGEGEPDEYLFEQLKAALDALEQEKDPQIVVLIYELKIIAAAGYMPSLSECVSCGSAEGKMSFSPGMGGILCPRCKSRDNAAILLSEGALKLLRLFQRLDMRRLGKIEVKPVTKEQMRQCIRQYIDTHIDIKWKSRHFIDQMEKHGL